MIEMVRAWWRWVLGLFRRGPKVVTFPPPPSAGNWRELPPLPPPPEEPYVDRWSAHQQPARPPLRRRSLPNVPLTRRCQVCKTDTDQWRAYADGRVHCLRCDLNPKPKRGKR